MRTVIIGAGVAGLSIGWRLAQAGADVVVLERAQPGRAATWASAGMLAATAETGEAPQSESQYAHHALGLWPGFAAELEDASGCRIAFRQDGALLVARNDEEAAHRRAQAADAGVAFISGDEARAMVPGLASEVIGALWAPNEAQVDNRALGRALVHAFLRAGGTLQANEAAVRVDAMASGGVAVRTPFSVYEADAVILAAGAWSGDIGGLPAEALPKVGPVKGEMIALRPGAEGASPGPFIWGNGIYLVPRGERLLVGATVVEAGFDTSLSVDAVDWLRTRAAAVMPDLAGWTLDEHWAGLRPGSPDGLPLIGPTAVDGVYVASGQYRNGILFAPAIAESVRTLVLERRIPPEVVAFDPRRFQN